MSTITVEQQNAIREFLDGRHIPTGLGTEEEACSIAAINLALTGRLTDEIPDCMSNVIGRWIIRIQDMMPDAMRNSPEWRALLPLAAGTGRSHEKERLAVALDWMWDTVLPQLQSVAVAHRFSDAWADMLKKKNAFAASAAADAADAVYAAARAADAAYATASAATRAVSNVADTAASAADAAYGAADGAAFWTTVDPVSALRRMIEVN